MRNQISIIVALVVMLAASAVYAQNQSIRVNVPFDFEVRGKTLPAGEYAVQRTRIETRGWVISGKSIKSPIAYLLGQSIQENRQSEITKLTFHQYGDRYFLVAFTTSDYKVSLPESKDERNLRREMMAKNKSDKPEVVMIAAVQ